MGFVVGLIIGCVFYRPLMRVVRGLWDGFAHEPLRRKGYYMRQEPRYGRHRAE